MSAGQQLHTLEQWTAGTAARGVGSSEIGHKDTFKAEIKIRKENADEWRMTTATNILLGLIVNTAVLYFLYQ